jgi:hypothetical protein
MSDCCSHIINMITRLFLHGSAVRRQSARLNKGTAARAKSDMSDVPSRGKRRAAASEAMEVEGKSEDGDGDPTPRKSEKRSAALEPYVLIDAPPTTRAKQRRKNEDGDAIDISEVLSTAWVGTGQVRRSHCIQN